MSIFWGKSENFSWNSIISIKTTAKKSSLQTSIAILLKLYKKHVTVTLQLMAFISIGMTASGTKSMFFLILKVSQILLSQLASFKTKKWSWDKHSFLLLILSINCYAQEDYNSRANNLRADYLSFNRNSSFMLALLLATDSKFVAEHK